MKWNRKRIVSMTAFVLALVLTCASAYADTFEGESGWLANFTGSALESNFKSSEIADSITDKLEPGDDMVFVVNIKNSDTITTNWYMSNEVLKSLEDTQAVANEGGYRYRLVYEGPASSSVIYDSIQIGGEKDQVAGKGLNEISDSMKDFFFLDTLKSGEGGKLTVTIALDGETQGNNYQDTLADIKMKFAVEKETANGKKTVKTGDDNNLYLLTLVTFLAGMLCLILGFIRSRQEKEGRHHV